MMMGRYDSMAGNGMDDGPTRGFLTTAEVWNKIVAAGTAKSKYSWHKKVLLSFLAGCYLSFGMLFAFIVGGQLGTIKAEQPGLFNIIFGFFGLPFGLTMIILMGADLFTSDVMFMIASFVEGKCTIVAVAWNLVWCWFGNLCGSLWMTQLCVWGEVFKGKAALDVIVSVSIAKTTTTFGVLVVRGMLCNWLVCIGVWQALTAQDVTGKFVGVFIPVTIFVASGFEHCIANQFAIPMGLRLGSGVSASEIAAHNLIPVTIGNFISAMLFMVGFYWVCIGSGHGRLVNTWNNACDRLVPHPLLNKWIRTEEKAVPKEAMSCDPSIQCHSAETSKRCHDVALQPGA